jgi:hypothetical protein
MFNEKTGVRKSRETVPLTGTSWIKSKTPLEYGQYLAGISVVWGHDLAGISTFFQDNILLDWPSTRKHLRIYGSSIQCSFKATRTEPSYVSPLTEFITVAANQLQTLSNRTAWFVRNSRTPWRPLTAGYQRKVPRAQWEHVRASCLKFNLLYYF